MGHGGIDRVGALVRPFDDRVAVVVDMIGVVAAPTHHPVAAGAAIEDVVAGIAGQRVVHPVAGGVDIGGTGQRQRFDVGTERVGHGGAHRIRS